MTNKIIWLSKTSREKKSMSNIYTMYKEINSNNIVNTFIIPFSKEKSNNKTTDDFLNTNIKFNSIYFGFDKNPEGESKQVIKFDMTNYPGNKFVSDLEDNFRAKKINLDNVDFIINKNYTRFNGNKIIYDDTNVIINFSISARCNLELGDFKYSVGAVKILNADNLSKNRNEIFNLIKDIEIIGLDIITGEDI